MADHEWLAIALLLSYRTIDCAFCAVDMHYQARAWASQGPKRLYERRRRLPQLLTQKFSRSPRSANPGSSDAWDQQHMPYGGESSTSDGHEERCFNIVAKPIDSAVLVARNRLLERAVRFNVPAPGCAGT